MGNSDEHDAPVVPELVRCAPVICKRARRRLNPHWHRYQKNYVYPFAKFRICRDIEADERDASVGTSYRFVTLPGWNKQSLEGRFARDVRAGLSSNPKRIDSMHFYDDRGSEL